MKISIAYAEHDQHAWMRLDVPDGISVREAIHMSGVLKRFPQLDLDRNKVGVFGRLTALDVALKEGDRVEIYRPITADPRTVPRRKRDASQDED